MGLLSKAVSSTPDYNELPSHGGLLRLITQRHYTDSKQDSDIPLLNESIELSGSPMEKAVMEKLSTGYKKYGVFQGVIMEALKYSAGEFSGRLASIVSGFGSAHGLAPGRCMVLFGLSQDGELIGRHLSKTVPGNNIYCFQAKNPQEAFSLIKPYL